MNFLEIVKMWESGHLVDKKMLINGEETFTGTGGEFLKSGFEVVEEKKTLSDKIFSAHWKEVDIHNIEPAVLVEHIKQSLKKIIKRVSEEHNEERDEQIMPKRVIQIIKEEVGERLIQ